ncbi:MULTISPECIES: hypothetical protein [unclassified Mycobacterium]|uniref:hypothetical protein n=1 Tax=unclassified Mycobacterium TaxID=2642494 RepID=UPI000B0405D9|nr:MULTISPECIES: hypothetical protein [unclassified Mycobacterium]
MGSDDGPAPEHDPLAEEMDLITFQEADARLHREQVHTRNLIARLMEAADLDREEIEAQQTRLAALDRVQNRLQGQRTQPPLQKR